MFASCQTAPSVLFFIKFDKDKSVYAILKTDVVDTVQVDTSGFLCGTRKENVKIFAIRNITINRIRETTV